MYKIPSFNEMKEYYMKYKMKDVDYTSIDTVKILERGSNMPLNDTNIKPEVFYSLVWQEAVGRGLEAFNKENELIYNKFTGRILDQIEKIKMIDTLELLDEVYDNPKEKEILINLFSNPNKSRLLADYFYKSYYQGGTYFGDPVSLGTMEFAERLHDARRR